MTNSTNHTDDILQNTMAEMEKTARHAMRGAEQTAEDIARMGQHAADNVQDVAGEMSTALEESVRRNPLTTLGMVAVTGFIIGALWKS